MYKRVIRICNAILFYRFLLFFGFVCCCCFYLTTFKFCLCEVQKNLGIITPHFTAIRLSACQTALQPTAASPAIFIIVVIGNITHQTTFNCISLANTHVHRYASVSLAAPDWPTHLIFFLFFAAVGRSRCVPGLARS